MSKGVVTSIVGVLVSIGTVLAINLAVNGASFGCHRVMHGGQIAQLDTLKKKLDTDKAELDSLAPQIRQAENDIAQSDRFLSNQEATLNVQENQLKTLKAQIDAIEAQARLGNLPRSEYDRYRNLTWQYDSIVKQAKPMVNAFDRNVGSHNAALTRAQNMIAQYNARVDAYNANVDKANSLSRQIGGPMMFVVIPRGGRR